MNIRSAPSYALVKELSNMQIRGGVVYVLASDPPLLPAVEPKKALENLIFSLTEFPFEEGDLQFGPPEAVNEHDRNTRVLVTSLNEEVEGDMYFYYNRVPVARLNIVGEFFLKDEIDFAALFPRLDAYAGVPLEESNFINTTRVDNTLDIVASSTGYMFEPGTKITIYPAI